MTVRMPPEPDASGFCLAARSELTAFAGFAFLMDGFNPLTVPCMAEVTLPAGAGEKRRSEHRGKFASGLADAVKGKFA